MINNLSQPLLCDAFDHTRLLGTYYLVGLKTQFTREKEPFVVITISDAFDTLDIYCRDQSCIIGELQPQSPVHIEMQRDINGKRPYFCCKYIQVADEKASGIDHIAFLPSMICPVIDDLHHLIFMIEGIKTKHLAEFLQQVLTQRNVGVKYTSCAGSINHHHNYAGGLLEHSLEVAEYFANDPSLKQEQRDLAVVAALLHDVGKTQTYTTDGHLTALGHLILHDSLTLEVCSQALNTLSKKHAGYANELRHIWTCATPKARYGIKAKTTTAKLLKQYDRASARLQTQRI
jgi:3'-5' exoribonuclease